MATQVGVIYEGPGGEASHVLMREDQSVIRRYEETALVGFYTWVNGSQRPIGSRGTPAYEDGALPEGSPTTVTFQGQTLEFPPSIPTGVAYPAYQFPGAGTNPNPADPTTMTPFTHPGNAQWVNERGSHVATEGTWTFTPLDGGQAQEIPTRWLRASQIYKDFFTLPAAPSVLNGRTLEFGELVVEVDCDQQPTVVLQPVATDAFTRLNPTRYERVGTKWRAVFTGTTGTRAYTNGLATVTFVDGDRILPVEVYRLARYRLATIAVSFTATPDQGPSPLRTSLAVTAQGEPPFQLVWSAVYPSPAVAFDPPTDVGGTTTYRPNHAATITGNQQTQRLRLTVTDVFDRVRTAERDVFVAGGAAPLRVRQRGDGLGTSVRRVKSPGSRQASPRVRGYL